MSCEEELEVPEPKIVIIGDANVGQTCIVQRALNGIFNEVNSSTLGAAYTSLLIYNGDKPISRLQIWDTAGQEKFRGMTPMYYRGRDVAILVFSIDDLTSFKGIDVWYKSLQENVTNEQEETHIDIYLVGNKKDLEGMRTVSRESAEQKAKEMSAKYYEVSAKTGESIEDLFRTIARLYNDRVNKVPTLEQEETKCQKVDITEKKQKQQKKPLC